MCTHLQSDGASLGSSSSRLCGRRSRTGMPMLWQKSTATTSCWKKDLQEGDVFRDKDQSVRRACQGRP